MSTYKSILIAIADGEHARFVRRISATGFRTERALDSADAHKRSGDLGSDRPGASFHSEATAHHGMTPQHDPHELAKEQFAHSVADILNDMPDDELEGLLIAAPAHSLNAIRARLNSSTASKLLGTLAKDLVKVPDGDLWDHLREIIPPGAGSRPH